MWLMAIACVNQIEIVLFSCSKVDNRSPVLIKVTAVTIDYVHSRTEILTDIKLVVQAKDFNFRDKSIHVKIKGS